MSQSNDVQQMLASFTQISVEEIQIYKTHKQKLTQIIIEKISDDEKLEKLQDEILAFRANPSKQSTDSNQDSKQSTDSNQASKQSTDSNQASNFVPDLDDLLEIITKMTEPSRIHDLLEIITKMTEPSRIHGKLLEQIGDVLRTNQSPQQKVKVIKNILV
jgi:hypothetical protein